MAALNAWAGHADPNHASLTSESLASGSSVLPDLHICASAWDLMSEHPSTTIGLNIMMDNCLICTPAH